MDFNHLASILLPGTFTKYEYKARERIHRSVADLRLLAIPTSWGRVADLNPNWGHLYKDLLHLSVLRLVVVPIVSRV